MVKIPGIFRLAAFFFNLLPVLLVIRGAIRKRRRSLKRIRKVIRNLA